MAYKFTPKNESEVSKGFAPLPTGTYPFEVMESEIAQSKSKKNTGREMVKVKLCVFGDNQDKHVYDYFADWFSEWKLKHICDTTGLGESYASGEIDPSNNAWRGRSGFVKIGIEVNKDTGEEKNAVIDYIVQEQPAATQTASIDRPRPNPPRIKPPQPAQPELAEQPADDVPF